MVRVDDGGVDAERLVRLLDGAELRSGRAAMLPTSFRMALRSAAESGTVEPSASRALVHRSSTDSGAPLQKSWFLPEPPPAFGRDLPASACNQHVISMSSAHHQHMIISVPSARHQHIAISTSSACHHVNRRDLAGDLPRDERPGDLARPEPAPPRRPIARQPPTSQSPLTSPSPPRPTQTSR